MKCTECGKDSVNPWSFYREEKCYICRQKAVIKEKEKPIINDEESTCREIKCNACGKEAAIEDKFCSSCGVLIERELIQSRDKEDSLAKVESKSGSYAWLISAVSLVFLLFNLSNKNNPEQEVERAKKQTEVNKIAKIAKQMINNTGYVCEKVSSITDDRDWDGSITIYCDKGAIGIRRQLPWPLGVN